MSGPWEKFQEEASGPWQKFQTPPSGDAIPLSRPSGYEPGAGAEIMGQFGKGLFRGLMSVPMTLSGATPEERRETSKRLGIREDSTAADVGQFITEAGAGVAATTALGAGITPFAPTIGRAILTGGIGRTAAPSVMKDIALRTAGGATAGGIGAGVVNPEDVGAGAAVGGVLGPLSALSSLGLVRQFYDPRSVSANTLRQLTEGVDLTAAAGQRSAVPGVELTLSERIARAGGTPNIALAQLENKLLQTASPADKQELVQRLVDNKALIQAQLDGVSGEIQRLGKVASPEYRNQLSEVRNNLLRELSMTEQSFQLAAKAAARGPGLSLLAPGKLLQDRARVLKKEMGEVTIEPAYKKAFELAGDAKIDISDLIAQAEDILGEPINQFTSKATPDITRALRELVRVPEPKAPFSDLPGAPVRAAPAGPPEATLNKLDAIRKVINEEYQNAILGGQRALSPTKARKLGKLHDTIDEIVEKSGLPEEAKKQYFEALRLYREEYAPRFKSRETSQLLQATAHNKFALMPEDAVKAFLSDEGAARQFTTTFGNDVDARRAMEAGTFTLLRNEAFDPATKTLDAGKAEAFIENRLAQLQELKQQGFDLETPLRQFSDRLRQIDEGGKLIVAARGLLQGDSAGEIIKNALGNPKAMAALMSRLDDNGRLALRDGVVSDITKMIDSLEPDQALKYLGAGNDTTIKMVLGKSGYEDMKMLAQTAKEVQDAAKRLRVLDPNVPINVSASVAERIRGLPPAKLGDLERIVAEIAERERYQSFAGLPGARTVGETVDESQVRVSSSFKNFLMRAATMANKVTSTIEGFVKQKTIAELVTLMHRDPDAAMRAIEAARAQKAAGPSPAKYFLLRSPVTVGAGASLPER